MKRRKPSKPLRLFLVRTLPDKDPEPGPPDCTAVEAGSMATAVREVLARLNSLSVPGIRWGKSRLVGCDELTEPRYRLRPERNGQWYRVTARTSRDTGVEGILIHAASLAWAATAGSRFFAERAEKQEASSGYPRETEIQSVEAIESRYEEEAVAALKRYKSPRLRAIRVRNKKQEARRKAAQ